MHNKAYYTKEGVLQFLYSNVVSYDERHFTSQNLACLHNFTAKFVNKHKYKAKKRATLA